MPGDPVSVSLFSQLLTKNKHKHKYLWHPRRQGANIYQIDIAKRKEKHLQKQKPVAYRYKL